MMRYLSPSDVGSQEKNELTGDFEVYNLLVNLNIIARERKTLCRLICVKIF